MTPADIPLPAIVTLYTDQVTMNVYEYMAIEANRYGYTTASDQPVTRHHMRREVKRRFHKLGWLPNDRPPTARDFQILRARLRAERFGDDEIQ